MRGTIHSSRRATTGRSRRRSETRAGVVARRDPPPDPGGRGCGRRGPVRVPVGRWSTPAEGPLAELGVTSTMWNGVGGWLNLLRVPPSGTWERRSADLYAVAEDWLTGPRRHGSTKDSNSRPPLPRGFGPASRKDIASWAGISVTTLAPALERMPLRGFRDERGGELLDLPRATLPAPTPPAPVRFLPTWDATLLVHARRTQILPERFRPMLFDTKTPHSSPSFLLDGQVAGRGSTSGGASWCRRSSRCRERRGRRSITRRTARSLAGVILRSRGGRRNARRPQAA